MEVINLEDIDENIIISLRRDYINFFDLINKNSFDSIKYIKLLCKDLSLIDIIKSLHKISFLEVYPIFKYKDVLENLKNLNLVGSNDNIICPIITKANKSIVKNKIKIENFRSNLSNDNIICNILKSLKLSDLQINHYLASNKDIFKSKF